MIGLWKLESTTGLWRLERQCDPATAKQWLAVFEKDDPQGVYKLSKNRPNGSVSAIRKALNAKIMKNPAKRKTSKKTRTPAQRAATARLVALNKARRKPRTAVQRKARKAKNTKPGYYPNPEKRIARKPRPANKSGMLYRVREERHATKSLGGGGFFVQVQRGAAWVTIARFYTKLMAVEYGRAKQRQYKTKTFRVFW